MKSSFQNPKINVEDQGVLPEKWLEPDDLIDPYDWYSACPHCQHWDLVGTRWGGICHKCSWSFTVYPD